jgi:hypothetical protein
MKGNSQGDWKLGSNLESGVLDTTKATAQLISDLKLRQMGQRFAEFLKDLSPLFLSILIERKACLGHGHNTLHPKSIPQSAVEVMVIFIPCFLSAAAIFSSLLELMQESSQSLQVIKTSHVIEMTMQRVINLYTQMTP